eukprot:12404078-Karenia_brevis.AAC.1
MPMLTAQALAGLNGNLPEAKKVSQQLVLELPQKALSQILDDTAHAHRFADASLVDKATLQSESQP